MLVWFKEMHCNKILSGSNQNAHLKSREQVKTKKDNKLNYVNGFVQLANTTKCFKNGKSNVFDARNNLCWKRVGIHRLNFVFS